VKYAFIGRHRRLWPVSVQCRVLKVSTAGYHEHVARRALDAPFPKTPQRRSAACAHPCHSRRDAWRLRVAACLEGTAGAWRFTSARCSSKKAGSPPNLGRPAYSSLWGTCSRGKVTSGSVSPLLFSIDECGVSPSGESSPLPRQAMPRHAGAALVDDEKKRRRRDSWFASSPAPRHPAGRGPRRGLDGPPRPNPSLKTDAFPPRMLCASPPWPARRGGGACFVR